MTMHSYTRRDFVLLGMAAMLAVPYRYAGGGKPLLSFSTLGCPDWTLKAGNGFERPIGTAERGERKQWLPTPRITVRDSQHRRHPQQDKISSCIRMHGHLFYFLSGH